jgi:hypothetical protein
MNLKDTYIDQLVEYRRIAREKNDWNLSDEIRSFLDNKLIFIFDTKTADGEPFQEVYYLTEGYFNKARMEKIESLYKVKFASNRAFVEWNIKKDIAAEKFLDSWIYIQSKTLTSP